MNPRITTTRRATRDEWLRAWNDCDHSTFYHSPMWAEIWETATAGKIRPCPLRIQFSNQTSAIITLTFRRHRLGLVKHFSSSQAGTYGGWISETPLDMQQTELLFNLMVERFHRLAWRVNPLDEAAVAAAAAWGQADETQVLDLRDGFEGLLRRWTKGHRSAARKARREGVEVRPARGVSEWAEYYSIYMDSVRRWGDRTTLVHPWSLFEAMIDRSPEQIQLWIATMEDRLIAGALTFRSRTHVSYWHGAALESHFHLRPVHWLLHEVIRTACDEGYRWFDFNPSGGLDGVRAFKRGFGTQSLPTPTVSVPPRQR